MTRDAANDERNLALLAEQFDEELAGAGATPAREDTPLEVAACLRKLHQLWPAESSARSAALSPRSAATESLILTTRDQRHFGRFELRERLAAGGFGIVYRAFDPILKREVALKLPRIAALLDEQLRARFLREGRAAAALQHPHIVPVLEAGEIDQVCYLAMVFCPGPDLASWMATRQGPTPSKQAARITLAIAEALDHAHTQGIVHRDIKPKNVLLDPSRTAEGLPYVPKLTDFGIARMTLDPGLTTADGALLGTPQYMSPEQAAGRHAEVGPATDIYSLGTVLYQLLTGAPPIRGRDTADMLRRIESQEPVSVRRLTPAVPADLAAIAHKCLEKRPADRYPSAALLADDLRRYLSDQPILARPVSRPEKSWRWCRRHPLVAGLTAMLAASLLIGTGVSTYFAFEARMNARESERNAREATAQRDLTRRHLYASQMNLAEKAWEAGDIARVLELLEAQKPQHNEGEDLRGWEWHYLWRLCHSDRLVLSHTSLDLAFSPDGRLLASAGEDGTIKMWDPRDGRDIRTIRAHSDQVVKIAFSHDGYLLASAGLDKTVKFWDVATGEPAGAPLEHEAILRCLAFSPDDKLLASADRQLPVRLWDVATGRQTATFSGLHRSYACRFAVAFDLDGRTLATAGEDNVIGLWSVAGAAPIRKLTGHDAAIHTVEYHPNGTLLASGSDDGTIRFWSLPDGREPAVLTGHRNAVGSVAFSPDGERLLSCDRSGTIITWDVESKREIRSFKGHTDSVTRARFSPDGTLIASGSRDGTVRVWDAAGTHGPRTLRAHRYWVNGVALSPDGRRVASIGGCLSDTNLWVFDADSGQPYLALKHAGWLRPVAFHPNGKHFATAGYDQKVRLWDAESGAPIQAFEERPGRILSIAFSPDGRLLASFGGEGPDYFIKLWQVSTGRELAMLSGHTAEVESLAFSPDGRLLADCDGGGFVSLWEVDTGEPFWSLKAHVPSCCGLAFTPDGKRVVSGGFDRTVKLWDVMTGGLVGTLKGHENDVTDVRVSSDGQVIASCGKDRLIKLWDSRPLTPERHDQLRAFELVEALFQRWQLKEDVIAALEADARLPQAVREQALEMARQRFQTPKELSQTAGVR